VSGHIEDRWYKTVNGRKVKTSRYGTGLRWRVRWIDPGGRERARSFRTRDEADRYLTEIRHEIQTGAYVPPDRSRVTLREYAAEWLAAQSFDPVTRERSTSMIGHHIRPGLGERTLRELAARPSLVQAWLSGLKLAPSSALRVLGQLSTIMRAAQADGLIRVNPCVSPVVKPRRITRRQIEPWTPQIIAAVHAGLPHDRYRGMVDAGTGLGLRQSELFGLAVDAVRFLERAVHVTQQVKIVTGRLVFAPPKMAKTRVVPLARQTAEALSEHVAAGYPAEVTLPWHEPGTRRHGKPHTSVLMFTSGDGRALNRNTFNQTVWRPAREAAGLADDRVNGCHAMRHVYASTLVAGGVDPRTVAEYLGHSDGGALVLRTYSHLMPDAEDRARRAIEDALAAQSPPSKSHTTRDTLGL
jgi:integrase